MSEEIQVIDMQHINNSNQTSFLSKLKLKMQQGYKINIVFKKVFNFNQSAPQSDRNNNNNNSYEQNFKNKSQIHVQEEIIFSPDNFEQLIVEGQIQQGPQLCLNQLQQIQGDNADKIQLDFESDSQQKKKPASNKSFLRKKQHIEAKIATQQLENKLSELNNKFQQHNSEFIFFENAYKQILDQCIEIEEEEKHILDLPTKKKLWVLRVECQIQRAQCFRRMLKLHDAIKILEIVIKRYAINDPNLFTKLLLELASLNYESYNFTRALDYYAKLLRIYEKLNWKVDICFVLSEMSVIFAIFSQIEQAKRLAYEALEIGQSQLISDDFRLANCFDALGMVCFLNKEYLFSIEQLQKSLKIKNLQESSSFQQYYNIQGIMDIIYRKPKHTIFQVRHIQQHVYLRKLSPNLNMHQILLSNQYFIFLIQEKQITSLYWQKSSLIQEQLQLVMEMLRMDKYHLRKPTEYKKNYFKINIHYQIEHKHTCNPIKNFNHFLDINILIFLCPNQLKQRKKLKKKKKKFKQLSDFQ